MRSFFFILLLMQCFMVVASGSTPENNPNSNIRINIKNGEIQDLIRWVAEASGRNVIIDPRVKGKVSVISNDSMSPDEAYQALLSVLQVHGFAAVDNNGLLKIVPESLARQNALPVVDSKARDTDELVIQIIKPSHIAVNKLQALLRPLLPQSSYLVTHPDSNALIIADRAANITKLLGIVERIDQASERTIDVVELKFASAQEVARMIQAIWPTQGQDNAAQSYQLAIDERTNSLLVSAAASERKKIRQIIDTMDRPADSNGNTQVIYLHYLKAKEVAGILKAMVENIKRGSTDISISNARVSIEPGETTNALILTAPQTLMSTMLDVIKKLDIRRAQVLVEAIIVEVKDESALELGVQWSTSDSAKDGSGVVAGTRFSFDGSDSFGQFAEGSFGTGLSLGFYNNGSLNALVKAMATDDAFNILSTPTLVTLDNEEAKIVVGQNVPFITGTTGGSGTSDNPFQTIERKDVGTKLAITPQINGGDAITLKILQEISSINTKTEAADVVTDTRSIETSVLIRDGDVLVLGGLITDEVVKNTSKVPLLGDIPWLGRLFTADRNTTRKRNLMLFVKPKIMKNFDVAASISQGRYRFIQEAQRQFGKKLQGSEAQEGDYLILPDVEALKPETPTSFIQDSRSG
ncbi:MAG: type II secretion system secretin GspD [Endozoicomonas sp.]|uniref:type II secretion system secretin GspD n=1 Tax=Endozoicomonas sp. TaxID=1892382 RepID=UPI003D9B7206